MIACTVCEFKTTGDIWTRTHNPISDLQFYSKYTPTDLDTPIDTENNETFRELILSEIKKAYEQIQTRKYVKDVCPNCGGPIEIEME